MRLDFYGGARIQVCDIGSTPSLIKAADDVVDSDYIVDDVCNRAKH
jgi:hypothetical protein